MINETKYIGNILNIYLLIHIINNLYDVCMFIPRLIKCIFIFNL